MLAVEGIISKDDGMAIMKGLEAIEKEISGGSFVSSASWKIFI